MSSVRGTKFVSFNESAFAPIEDMLTATGRGIAQAQKAMDMASIEIQKEIDATEALAGTGIQATWYAIPEVELSLKIALSIEGKTGAGSAGETGSGGSGSKAAGGKIRITPINARFQNQFDFSQQVASELKVKIVPVPKPAGATKTVPDLEGMTLDNAKKALEENKFKYKLSRVAGTPSREGQETEVKKVTPEAGTTVSYDYDKEVTVEYVQKQ